MNGFFQAIMGLGTPFNMIVMVVLIGCVTGVLIEIAKQIRKYGCHRQELEFKRELVERGLGAEEIERIVRSQPGDAARDKAG